MLSPGDIEAIRRVARARELALVVLFGSVATGRDRRDSDVDLGVLARDGEGLSFRRLGELARDLSAEIGREADVVDLRAADAILRFEIVSHGKVLVSDPEDVWTEFCARTFIDHDDLVPFLPALIAGVGRAARGGR